MFPQNTDLICDPSKRQEFVFLFDVTNGNPNGDPDSMNAPRIDPETSHGLVTDVALKRKVRNYLALTRQMPMFIQSEVALNVLKQEAAGRVEPPLTDDERKTKKPIPRLASRLCKEYFDIRMFGAVLATGDKEDRLNAGQVRGPVQLTFARSVGPVELLDQAITRQARTTEKRMETGPTEFGRKTIIPYGLYRAHGFINPFLAEQTEVRRNDLAAFWEAMINLFEFDRSAARPEMSVCGLYIYTHENQLGNAPAHSLLNRVTIEPRVGVRIPRKCDDYVVSVNNSGLSTSITPTPLVDHFGSCNGQN